MSGQLFLDGSVEKMMTEEEGGLFRNLEEKIEDLLERYQRLKEEKNDLYAALETEKAKVILLEKRLELLSQDREKVKTRIDQLLLRLKGVDF
ncbi:MAG: hypothetical protein A2170_05195 [Deltaproteobacteria bacterium RBG_13_53_10]|nr:MAG: hypothetical protein A2170_05195 [Deltaproteobacteria bacterium RBG_13_53_10]